MAGDFGFTPPALPARYDTELVVHVRHHVSLNPEKLAEFIERAIDQAAVNASLESPLRDLRVDYVGPLKERKL